MKSVDIMCKEDVESKSMIQEFQKLCEKFSREAPTKFRKKILLAWPPKHALVIKCGTLNQWLLLEQEIHSKFQS